ncbi:hypothetical protein [Fibrivirga algicola]|uniref:Uncharacterized protein n=1 Tax=Fibrivirga algicola TaxID=2950420 RepID=A0ABX0QGJ7_9BACT|nr:hypothetical protein [Fibrivirga algicola]NID09224.1 hypothetical protein [Fibrivirga algicola]
MRIRYSLIFILLVNTTLFAQTSQFTATINGKEFKAGGQRLKLPLPGSMRYLAIAGMNVKPDVQLWLRFFYLNDLKPGTYPILGENDKSVKATFDKNNPNTNAVYALLDYTEETKGMGHAFQDGESYEGTVTISKVTDTSIEGTFSGTLKGQTYKKRVMATLSGFGLRQNLEDKAITAAGGGMFVKGDPHDHDNTRKGDKTDDIKVENGTFKVYWGKDDKAKQ